MPWRKANPNASNSSDLFCSDSRGNFESALSRVRQTKRVMRVMRKPRSQILLLSSRPSYTAMEINADLRCDL